MNAELFEDQALNNISPLPKHVFDVPKIETNFETKFRPHFLLLSFWSLSLQTCRGLLCLFSFLSQQWLSECKLRTGCWSL